MPLKDMIVLQPDKVCAKASITAASSSGDSAKYWSITIRFLMRFAQPIMYTIAFTGEKPVVSISKNIVFSLNMLSEKLSFFM